MQNVFFTNYCLVYSIDIHIHLAPPRLRIAVVRSKGFVKYLALHNPSNNELLCCDFNKNTVTSVVVSFWKFSFLLNTVETRY